jgi:hypothetical protein
LKTFWSYADYPLWKRPSVYLHFPYNHGFYCSRTAPFYCSRTAPCGHEPPILFVCVMKTSTLLIVEAHAVCVSVPEPAPLRVVRTSVSPMSTSAACAALPKAVPFRKARFTGSAEQPRWDASKLTYVAYSKDICAATGNESWHGLAYAKTGLKITDWQKLFPGAQIQQQIGAFGSLREACMTASTFSEHGQCPHQGRRSDIRQHKCRADVGV